MNRRELVKIRLEHLKRDLGVAKLLAVTKNADAQDIGYAFEAGQVDFGENRVDQLAERAQKLSGLDYKNLNWHFIGRLQTNKINKLFSISGLRSIHSVDSLKLLEQLYSKQDKLVAKEVALYLQVNTSEESEKAGFLDYDQLAAAVNFCLNHEGERLKLKGLMTMSKWRTNSLKADAEICFRRLKNLKRKLEYDFFVGDLELSMGMSQDFDVAVREGSSWVRIGSHLFSPEKEH